MEPLEIRSRLKEIGITISGIARDLGVTPSSVCDVLSRGKVSHKIHSHVAEQIGMTINEVWPDLYDIDCQPRKAGHPLTKGKI